MSIVVVEVEAMNMLARKNLDGSTVKGMCICACLTVSFALASCDGANQGVQIGTGQGSDPVVVDFPIAYIKSPLPLDDNGDLIQTDVREQITFDFGADLYVKDRASPSSLARNVTGELMQGLAAVRDVCDIPLIASGGAGVREHFLSVFEEAHVDGALAASVFHSAEIPIPQLKQYLAENQVDIRL